MSFYRKRAVGLCAAVLLALWPLWSLAQEAQDSGIVQLERFIAAAVTAEGRFEQSVSALSGRKPQLSSGHFVFERPGRFRWEYLKPYPQLLVSDGEELWTWDPELEQATVQPVGDALGSTPAAILAGDGSLERNFRLIAERADEDGLAWVRAEPLQDDGAFVLVRVGLSGDMLRRMEMHDQFGQISVIDFPDLVTGVQPDPAQFRFVLPEGADVIGR